MAMTFEQYRDLRKKGYSQSQLQDLNQENKPKSFFSKLGEALKTRASNFADTSRSVNAGQITSPEATLRGAGQIAGAVSDVAGIALGSAAKTAFRSLPQQGQENIRSIGTGIAKSRPGQALMSGMQTGAEAYGGFKQNNPRLATNLEAVGNVASVIPVGFGGKVAGKEGINIAKDVAGLTKRIGKSNIDDVIETGISKGIRPSVVGKNSLSQMNQYKTKAKEAVLNIVKNKNNLSYVDEFGESVTGKLPSSLKELTEAVDQTKKRIFNEYSALATKAGGTGVAVDLNKVTSELGKIVNDKVIQTISPETAQYASNLIERFSKQGSFTPEQAQQAIANLNESLQSFYKNPTYGTYRQAQIDALITNNLRESLDEVITSATGPGYAELKKAYGALKTIEKDAIKRAVVEGRKNAKGLVDFTDIFSAGDVVMGVATGNSAQVAKGAIQKAVSSYIKRLNSPDNAIKQMFKKVEGAIEKGKSSSAPFVPKSMTGKGLQSLKGKGGLNLQTVGGGKAGYSDPLLQEVRKYKSAEEFVKAQSSPDSHFEYHLSTDSKLPEGKTFGDLPKSNEAGVRGGSGSEVFSSKNPAMWHSQLGYEGLGKTPDNVYLVEVKNPQTTKMQIEGGIPKSLQTSNAPGDVKIVKNLGKVDGTFDSGLFEFEKDKALTDLWKKAQEKPAEIKEETPVATVTEKIEKEESVKVLEGIENDIPLKTAISAHSGTSFDPEKRGKSRVDDYVDTIKSDYEELQALATTPEKQAILDEMFPSYRNGYKDRMIETLNAESRTVSTMITGPANFNVERNRKRNETADKRRDEAIEFRKKLIAKIKNAINPSQASSFLGTSQKTIEAMGEKLADLKATQARMKEANRIIRAGKNVAEELGKLGYAPDIVKTLQLPDYAGRIGFASFELTSINNKIKALEKREKLTARKREIADTIGNTEFTMGDVRVVKNFDENRIQIIFPGKPDSGMISKLKGKGFRWSPKNTAWQRVLTNRAIYDAKALLESEPVVTKKEDIEPDYVPFKLKSDAAILKEDTADARIAMQEAVSATLFNEKLWDRIQDRTSEGMTDFDDFGFLTTLREQLETGKKVDPEVIRQAIEIIGKYGIPLSDMAFSMRKSEEKPLENQTEAFVRGADQVKVELLARVHDGKLKTRDYQEMSYFLDLVSPHIAEMAANIGGKPYDENADGMYDWISNTISIFDNVQNTQNLKQTFYHEIGHHLSRYIPSEMFDQLYEKFTVEQMAYYEAHPEAKMAENLSQEAKMAHFAKYNVDYQFFNFDEYFAEMIRNKTEAEIREKFGVENESATMRVVRYAKELIKAMYEAIRKYRTTDAADKAFSLLTSGVKLEVSNQFGLVEARLNRNQDYQAKLKRRRARLYRAYERNIDKLEPTKAIAFERAFNREISEEALHEASDILIREGIKTADFYAFKVKKLPEQKYNGAFLAPQFADEYRSIIDSMAEMVDSERNMMEEQEIAQTFADYIDPELESQLSSFESTLKKVRNEKGKEILQSGDFEGVKKFLITRGYSASDVDNMFYSGEQSQDDILDRFREIIMQRDPGLLTGRKAEKGLSLRKQIMSAKENIEAGKSMFSEQYKDYQAEAESLLKKSYALFSKDDQRFIDASLMLKNALKSVRNEKEKRVAMQTGSKLGKSIVRAKYRGIINEFQDRKRKVRYAKEFFGLSDAQFKKIGGNVAVQYLTEDQFSNFLNRFETAAAEEQEKNFLIEIIQKSIKERQLKKEKNLLRAWKYPTNLKNLTADQLRQFDAALSQLEDGDTVLTQRQIETLGNTELKGIQSLSEARKRLAKRMNVSPESLMNLSAGEFDAFRYDTALAERNPFYEVLVDDTNREMLQADQRFIELKDKTNRLISASRKSRPRSILGRLIPTDENIFKYLESENKAEIAKDMTPAEIEAAEFIRGTYSVVRDYLIERQMLNRSRENYITHIRKNFLEKWKDDGFVKAIKSVFEQYQEDEANFNILDESTGEILPMEKFFKFSLQRTGELDPTQNVGDAFLTYMRTFEKKRAFDAIIPKMEIYSDALANEKESKSGLQLDRSLKKLVREWINNKKGRRITVLKVKQGGKMDLAIRFGNTLVSVIDLGLSLPVGIATQIGEQGTNFVMLGTKAFAKSHTRTFTKQGKEILQKYQSFTQENPWSHLVEASDNVGDMMAKSLFILFRDSQWRANRQFLLGSLTDEEFASGTISPERLARMKRNMGRFRVVEGAESIVGSTSTGKFISKYKTWAVPIFRTTIKDLTEIYKNPKKIQSQEGQEIFRIAIVTALAALAAYALIGDDDDKPNSQKSFLEKLLAKSIRESLSLVGALDPRFWLAEPRLMAFLSDFTGSLIQIVKISEYDDSYVIGDRYTTSKDGSYEAGDLKGVNALQRTITPQFMKQFYPPEE